MKSGSSFLFEGKKEISRDEVTLKREKQESQKRERAKESGD